MAHVIGEHGRIAALVFGYPLLSPPGRTRNNKILWVSRNSVEPRSDLRIAAQRKIWPTAAAADPPARAARAE
jgi:hypothetical protein